MRLLQVSCSRLRLVLAEEGAWHGSELAILTVCPARAVVGLRLRSSGQPQALGRAEALTPQQPGCSPSSPEAPDGAAGPGPARSGCLSVSGLREEPQRRAPSAQARPGAPQTRAPRPPALPGRGCAAALRAGPLSAAGPCPASRPALLGSLGLGSCVPRTLKRPDGAPTRAGKGPPANSQGAAQPSSAQKSPERVCCGSRQGLG